MNLRETTANVQTTANIRPKVAQRPYGQPPIYRAGLLAVTGRNDPEPEVVTITLRAVPGNWQASPLVRLRRLLKCLLRGYGFKAVNIHTEQPKPRTERNEP
jgi:hypothetical protein